MIKSFPKPESAKGEPVPEETIDKLWERAGGQCEVVIDGKRCPIKPYAPTYQLKRFNTNHIKGRGRGGSNNLINLMIACTAVNSNHHHQRIEKGKESWTKFYKTHFWQPEGQTEAEAVR